MTKRERVTVTTLFSLAGVLALAFWTYERAGGPAAVDAAYALTFLFILAVVSAVLGGIAALTARQGRQVDERDHLIALRSQFVRGNLYLVLAITVMSLAVIAGENAIANWMLLAILIIELASGLVMLALYRRAA